jgi:hypothetical protein
MNPPPIRRNRREPSCSLPYSAVMAIPRLFVIQFLSYRDTDRRSRTVHKSSAVHRHWSQLLCQRRPTQQAPGHLRAGDEGDYLATGIPAGSFPIYSASEAHSVRRRGLSPRLTVARTQRAPRVCTASSSRWPRRSQPAGSCDIAQSTSSDQPPRVRGGRAASVRHTGQVCGSMSDYSSVVVDPLRARRGCKSDAVVADGSA